MTSARVPVAPSWVRPAVPSDAAPDKPTVAGELTDDMKKMGTWADVCDRPDDAVTVKEVRRASMDLRRDIRQTETLKIQGIRAAQKRP